MILSLPGSLPQGPQPKDVLVRTVVRVGATDPREMSKLSQRRAAWVLEPHFRIRWSKLYENQTKIVVTRAPWHKLFTNTRSALRSTRQKPDRLTKSMFGDFRLFYL